MQWEVIKRAEKSAKTREAFASVGRNAITLSSGAVRLIDDYKSYGYAEILRSKRGRSVFIGIRFLSEPTSDSIVVKRKMQAGKEIEGAVITSAEIVDKAFGETVAHQKGVTRYSVFCDSDSSNVLAIKIATGSNKDMNR